MDSKITIQVGDNFRPVIKVVEKETDDVRDQLVSKLTQMLYASPQDASRTFEVKPVPSNSNEKVYNLSPVQDELGYFKNRIVHKLIYDGVNVNEYNRGLLYSEYEQKVDEFFLWLHQKVYHFCEAPKETEDEAWPPANPTVG